MGHSAKKFGLDINESLSKEFLVASSHKVVTQKQEIITGVDDINAVDNIVFQENYSTVSDSNSSSPVQKKGKDDAFQKLIRLVRK